MEKREINEDLLRIIDVLELSERLVRWKKAIREAPWKIDVERQRLAMESWKETEGEDIQIRRAKLFKKILEGASIAIQEFDLIVGRVTEDILGASTSIDICGDYIPGLWDEVEDLNLTLTSKGSLSSQDREILRECTRFFAGKTAPDHVAEAWRCVVGSWAQDYEETKGKDPVLSTGFLPGTTSTVMWDKVLDRGLQGIIKEAEAGIRRFKEQKETCIDKFYFWQSVIITCEGMINYARRYAELARRMAEGEQNPVRRNELAEIARVCEWVPENPARTFHEAVQSIHFVGLGKNLEHPATFFPAIGRADQYLWPYFERDLREGHSTLERMAELFGCGIVHWGSQIFVASAQYRETHQNSFGINNIMVGGVDGEGQDSANELSYLILHVVGLLKMSSPTVGFRWHSRTPRWLLTKALDTNFKTKGGIPLFQNDMHVIKRFVTDGIPLEEARDYYGLGCVTPVVPGKVEHMGSEGIGAINIAFILDMTLHNGVSAVTGKQLGLVTGDPRTFKTFEELYEAFKRQHEFVTRRILWLGSLAREVNAKYVRLPFLSSIIAQGCMEKGKDVLYSDPSYHCFAISDRAIVDTADSLMAVKKLVFDEKKLTMNELLDALDSDFEGKRGEEIRQLCLAAPKFGNDIDEADWMAHDVGSFSASVIHSYNTHPYESYRISREGLSWHYFGGLGVGALPNGRKAKEPLNDGSISPMRGVDKFGPTAVLRSALKARFDEAYATVLNQKFSSTVMQSPESREKLALLTETFLKNGGQHIQYNLLDTQELLDAKVNPEKHRDLIVRVGGFSAYFVQLSKEIQDDVIYRSEHGVC